MKTNSKKVISIVRELLALRHKSITQEYVFFNKVLSVNLPFDGAIKMSYIKQSDTKLSEKALTLLEPMNMNTFFLSLQSLLMLLKFAITNISEETFDSYGSIEKKDYDNVIEMLLVTNEKLNHNDFDAAHFVYANYHLNSIRNIQSTIVRSFYIFSIIAPDKSMFSEKVQREYLDFNKAFVEKYQYSISDYLSVIFGLLYLDLSDKCALSYAFVYENMDTSFNQISISEKARKIISDLSTDFNQLKEWCNTTLDDWWNFDNFFESPVMVLPGNYFCSISDRTLYNAFFEKLFWHIRACYGEQDTKFNAFFGRPYEKYIQQLTDETVKLSGKYQFIDEFEYSPSNKDSSDAYIRFEHRLIIVEAKSFSPIMESISKGDPEKIEKSINKLFVKPIIQADKAYEDICKYPEGERFNGVTEIFIISVTMDNVQAVPEYVNNAHAKILKDKKCDDVKYFFNLNIEEYELLMVQIEKGIDIFDLLKEYFMMKDLSPFSNFIFHKTKDNNTVPIFISNKSNSTLNILRENLFKK